MSSWALPLWSDDGLKTDKNCTACFEYVIRLCPHKSSAYRIIQVLVPVKDIRILLKILMCFAKTKSIKIFPTKKDFNQIIFCGETLEKKTCRVQFLMFLT